MYLKLNIVLMIFLVNVIIVATDGSPLCGANACQKIKCQPLEQIRDQCVIKKGILNERSGWCSCCPNCIKRLYEDQNCSVTLNTQLPARAQCSEGLVCDVRSKRCIKALT